MENREQQILLEIKSMMASIRSQLEQLDLKMAELQQSIDPEEVVPVSLDIAFDDVHVSDVEDVAPVEAEPVIVLPQDEDDDLPVDDLPAEPEPSVPELPVFESVPVAEEPERAAAVEPEPYAQADAVPVIDAMTAKQAWRHDMPGTPVKDIRSAISLNDRILFINHLFDEDPMAFQDTLTKINAFETLEQAIEYLSETHPGWDMESDVVYRFMMAVRRRIR